MGKLLAPNDGVRGVDIETNSRKYKYDAVQKGVYVVENPRHAAQLRANGFTEASLNTFVAGDGQRGYTCSECGFGSWFVKCSRCGNENSRILTDGD